MVFSWSPLMECPHNTDCLQASVEETFFLQNMDVRVGEEPASKSFTKFYQSTPYIRNVDSDLRKWCFD